MPFRVLDHTADLGFEATAANLPSLFHEGSRALFACMVDGRIRPLKTRPVSVEAPDREALFVEFLTELLALQDAEGFLSGETNVAIHPPTSPDTPWRLEGTVRGESFDPGRHRSRSEIKAVTYHRLAIEEAPSGLRATVYLDL